jgi:acyl carrier protein
MEASINRSVLDRVVHTIKRSVRTDDAAVNLETRLADHLKLTRIGRLRLGIALEEVFNVELSDEMLTQAATVDDIVRYLVRHYYRDIDLSETNEAEGEDAAALIGTVNWAWRAPVVESRFES